MSMNPIVWWKCIQRSGKISESLCEFAVKLLTMPASSASVERIFSNFGLVQTKLRNRLGLEKATKLVTCYRHLRGDHDIEW